MGELTSSSPDRVFYQHTDTVAEAAEVNRLASYAEENIGTLFLLEHGDAGTREREVSALHCDNLEVRFQVDSTASPSCAQPTGIKFTGVVPTGELRALRIFGKDCRPGYGVNGIVPVLDNVILA